ncbi:hypothetical protein Tco_0435990 [Tanacetum coccineum]
MHRNTNFNDIYVDGRLLLGRWWSEERNLRNSCRKVWNGRHRRQGRERNFWHVRDSRHVWQCRDGGHLRLWHVRDGGHLRLWYVWNGGYLTEDETVDRDEDGY